MPEYIEINRCCTDRECIMDNVAVRSLIVPKEDISDFLARLAETDSAKFYMEPPYLPGSSL